MRQRWIHLYVVLAVAACLPIAHGQDGGIEPAPPITDAQRQQTHEARRRMLNNTRRIIFNNDGNSPVYYAKAPTPEAMIEARMAQLTGTQVDAISYCPWSAGFGIFTHRTDVGQRFTTTSGRFKNNITAALYEQGTDPLQIATNFADANGMELLFSLRVNDTHDCKLKDDGSLYYPELFPEWKKQNRDKLHGTPEDRSKHGRWSAVDFGEAEVRDLTYRFLEEACRKYPIDGIELDFFRHPHLFRRVSREWDGATEKERAQMTQLMRRIREMTEREAAYRGGKPYLVAIRVPDSVEACRWLGIDLEQWLAAGLVDILIPSGYWRFNPWGYSVELAHRYDVKVYAGLSDTRVLDDGELVRIRMSRQAYRARAARAWQAGVDGIYSFNEQHPERPYMREIGSSKTLEGLDKLYFASALGASGADMYFADGRQYFNIPTLTPDDRYYRWGPVTIKPGAAHRVPFPVGDNLADDTPVDANASAPTVVCRVQLAPKSQAAHLTARMNGHPLTATGHTATEKDEQIVSFNVPIKIVNQGANTFDLALAEAAGAPIEIRDLQLLVDFPFDKTPWPEQIDR